ncbi:MAG: hypothetical protein JSW00_04775 [Thermoplasmata archaeon]|nr:MAG: hypothetical protein JSW00_04775 [Thermoplasmata archaeon]
MPKWSVGDTWKYEKSLDLVNTPYFYEVIHEVNDTLFIDVDGTNHKVYELEFTAEMLGTRSHHYISTSDLATVKSVDYFKVLGEEGTVVHIYYPPKKELDFPMYVGKTWTLTFSEDEYNDYYRFRVNLTRTYNYTVEEIEYVEVAAGTFECYRIKSEKHTGDVSYIWYSSEVKNIVKKASELTGQADLELTSYSVADISDEGENNIFTLPYLMFLIFIPIIIVALIFGLVFMRNRKVKESNVPLMYVQPYDAGPQQSYVLYQQHPEYPPIQNQVPITQSQSPSQGPSMQPQSQIIRCPNCYNTLLIPSMERQVSVQCPFCGMGIKMD